MKYLLPILILLCSLSSFAQRYKRIHRRAIVVDTHNDILSAGAMKGLVLEDDLRGITHSDLARFKKGGVDVQVFSVFCNETFDKGTAFNFANREIDSLYANARRNTSKMRIVTTPAELRAAVKEGKLAAMMGVEGGHMIEDKMSYLDSLFNRGARYLTLTWNNSTSWATSAKDETEAGFNGKKGLSDFGREVVRRMNELGMMIDISHVGAQTVAEVLALTTKPVIASHSSVYALNPHFRNLTDDQIKAIAKNGGVIQVNFYPGFIDSSFTERKKAFDREHKKETDSLIALKRGTSYAGVYLTNTYPEEVKQFVPPISTLIDHIDYIVRLVGVDFVGLGADYDGISYLPDGLHDVTTYPKITKALLDRGYSAKDITKILGGNFIRVFEANMRKD